MGAGRAGRQILEPDRPHFIHLRGMTPDIDETLATDVSGRKRKLHAGENIAVRRDVAGSVSCAAGGRFEIILSDLCRYGTELVDIADQGWLMKKFAQFIRVHTQTHGRAIPVNHGW